MEQSVSQQLTSVETELNQSIAQGVAEQTEPTPTIDEGGVSPRLTSAEAADKPKA